MNTLLLAVTAISLTAAFFSIMSLRKVRLADQQRSDARVAALMTAADSTPHPAANSGWNSVAGELQWTSESSVAERLVNREPRSSPRAAEPASGERFFGTVQREQPASPRFAFAAGLALIVALAGAAIVFTSSNHDKAEAPAAKAVHATPLELVSLAHSRDAGGLTINGVVRNPATGPKLEGLTAVVSLIDEGGGLISTKDVPLDYRALGPGEEAPFRITVPDSGSIARYRVSFRAGTDVVPHVDRRTDAKVASAL